MESTYKTPAVEAGEKEGEETFQCQGCNQIEFAELAEYHWSGERFCEDCAEKVGGCRWEYRFR